MRQFCTLAAVVGVLAGLVGGCDGNGGAVSVRWRIVDLSLGDVYDPKHNSDAFGVCCPFEHIVGRVCSADSPWIVTQMSVTLNDPNDPQSQTPVVSESFPCGIGEETTNFTLPTGTYAMGLSVKIAGANGPMMGIVPPPEVHEIVRGEIVNLQVIEIGVQPLPSTGPPVPLPAPASMVNF